VASSAIPWEGLYAVLHTLLRDGSFQLAADLAERIVDVAGDNVHTGGRGESDQSSQQCVFDQVLTGFVPVQVPQDFSYSQELVYHKYAS
jgi:hypothetical protein